MNVKIRARSSRRIGVRASLACAVACLLACTGCQSISRISSPHGGESGVAFVHNDYYFTRNALQADVPSYGEKINAWPGANHYQVHGVLRDVEARELARGTLHMTRSSLVSAIGESRVGEFAEVAAEGKRESSARVGVRYVVRGVTPKEVIDRINDDPEALAWLRRAGNPRVVIQHVVLLAQEADRTDSSSGGARVGVKPGDADLGAKLGVEGSGEGTERHEVATAVIWAYKMHELEWTTAANGTRRVRTLDPDLPGQPR